MTAPHQRRLKIMTLIIDGSAYDGQVNSFTLDPNAKAGNQQYTYSSAGEGQNSFYEETDDQWSLKLKFFSDWRDGEISDILSDPANNKKVVDFQIDHHPDIVGEHIRWTGQMMILMPAIGGDTRTTESQDVTFPVIGEPVKERMS